MSKKTRASFQHQWTQFSPAVQGCLQQILTAHGPAAATLATEALVLQHQEKHDPSRSRTLLRPTSPSPVLGRTMPARLPLREAIPRALALDCQAAQVFLGDPSYMRFKPLPQKLIMTLQQQVRKARLVSLIIHASFAINLASAREQARKSSLSHWKGTLHHAERLRATSVVVHLGRYQGLNRERGIDHFLQGMQQSLTTGKKAPPMALLTRSDRV